MSNSQNHKTRFRELMKSLDKKYGPSSLDSNLTEEQLKEAQQAAEAGEGLHMIHARLSQKELEDLMTTAVVRALPHITPSLQQKLISFVTGAVVGGVMGNATYDILKHFIPYLHTVFMSSEVSDYMKRSAAAYELVRSAAPSELRNFAEDHYHGLLAFRVKTWRKIGEEIKKSEVGSTLRDVEILVLLQNVESYLFVPVRK